MIRERPIRASAQRRFSGTMAGAHGIVLPAYHTVVRAGRTLFPSRVFAPDEVDRLLKDGHQSRKIGKTIVKGHRRGWPIYMLTLEERATCPRSCLEWASCYGNRMQAAERVEHGPELMVTLEREIVALGQQYPRGFLVRLHILGDFWSREYVAFWGRMLSQVPALHVFGFTARDPGSDIGAGIAATVAKHGWQRFAIRFSGAAGRSGAARVIGPGEYDEDGVMCPAQTGATDCCATCALCWQSDRSITFRRH